VLYHIIYYSVDSHTQVLYHIIYYSVDSHTHVLYHVIYYSVDSHTHVLYHIIYYSVDSHNHENIVSITGKCLNGPSFIILYEFMTNQSLRHQLDTQGVLNMDRRVTILRGELVIQYMLQYTSV